MSTKVVICCDPVDGEHRDALVRHLATLKRQNLIESWHSGQVSAGAPVDAVIATRIDEADMILLLVSPDFLDSAHCYDVQMRRALDRHQRGEARVIPIITRACVYAGEPFAKLQVLPRNGVPITSWPLRDEAWTDVTAGIREGLTEGRAQPSPEEAVTRRSPFHNPLCEKVLEGLMEAYKANGFPSMGAWWFGPGEDAESEIQAAYSELAARDYIKPFGPDTYRLDYGGHAVIMRNIPISKEAIGVMHGLRAAFIEAGYPNPRAWGFSPGNEETRIAYSELQARGFIKSWTVSHWRLTDEGRDAILEPR